MREECQPWPNLFALKICKTCPFIKECATEALTAGMVLDSKEKIPADDVIAAGIVCTGDHLTTMELMAVGADREYIERNSRPDNCLKCDTEMCSEKKSTVKTIVPHHAKGVCVRCYQRERYRQKRRAAA